MKFIHAKQLRRLVFVKLTLLLISFALQTFTIAAQQQVIQPQTEQQQAEQPQVIQPQTEQQQAEQLQDDQQKLYVAIWNDGKTKRASPDKDKAKECLSKVISSDGKIENITKHILKHVAFPKGSGHHIPTVLLCWRIPSSGPGDKTKRLADAKSDLEILQKLYETERAIDEIKAFIQKLEDQQSLTVDEKQRLCEKIDEIKQYATKMQERLQRAELTEYEKSLKEKPEVQAFITAWSSFSIKPEAPINETKIQTIKDNLKKQKDYFDAVLGAVPSKLMTCIEHCVKKVLENFFTSPSTVNITENGNKISIMGVDICEKTVLKRTFQGAEYSTFIKNLAEADTAVLPDTENISKDIKDMTDGSKKVKITVVIGFDSIKNETYIASVYATSH